MSLAQRLPNRPLVVAIVGATGAVGAELIDQLARRRFPVGELRLLASPRSAGKTLPFNGRPVTVQALDDEAFKGVHVAFFSAGAGVSRRYAPVAAAAGALVVDNSSAFRMDADTPLVVPEVNPQALHAGARVIANPNCVAAIAVMALGPLHAVQPIRRVTLATYQAASGAGAAAMEELRASTAAYIDGAPFERKVLKHPYAFNLFSHDSDVDPATGYNGEETKVMDELRKILGAPDLRIGITCVRVPVLRAHSMAVTVEFEDPFDPVDARAVLAKAPGVRLVDDAAANHFPMPSEASGADEVLVGRIRKDSGDPSGRTLALRQATPDDRDALGALKLRASLAWGAHVDQLMAMPDAAEVEAALLPSSFVAEAGGRIVGFGAILPTDRDAELEDLFVEPDHWGQGIGRRLVAEAVSRATAMGATSLRVVSNGRAQGFYERCGFRPIGMVKTQLEPAPVLRRALPSHIHADPRFGLGLEQGVNRLVEHNPLWAEAFAQEAERIKIALGDLALAIEHYGSTAVPGLSAKPILDLQIGVTEIDHGLAFIEPMSALGYDYAGGQGIADHHIFGRGVARTHLAHVVVFGGEQWLASLRFRDRLRTDPHVRAAYQALKTQLAANTKSRADYSAGKSDFVSRYA